MKKRLKQTAAIPQELFLNMERGGSAAEVPGFKDRLRMCGRCMCATSSDNAVLESRRWKPSIELVLRPQATYVPGNFAVIPITREASMGISMIQTARGLDC
jgi:hypothetical protein